MSFYKFASDVFCIRSAPVFFISSELFVSAHDVPQNRDKSLGKYRGRTRAVVLG